MTLAAGGEASLERVWQATRVWLPKAPPGEGRLMRDVERGPAPSDTRLPSVIYAHGCRGLEDDATQWGTALSAAGYAVLAPDSAARGEPPPRCEDVRLYGREDLGRFHARTAEIRYTLRQMRTLSWVASDSIFLLGFDQGALVAADWSERDFLGVILTGWTCTSPDMRGGLSTPPDRPVLAIRWAEDPFFREPAWNGDCEAHLPPRPASRSLVLEGGGHSTAASPEARAAVLRFLNAHTLR